MLDYIKNKTIFANKYHTHSEAVIISCYCNSEKSPYRLAAFHTWYNTIKHLNHRIIECVIGDGESELDVFNDKDITTIRTPNLFWHKEAILNKIVSELPKQFKYIFWVDADVIFTNLDWLTDGVEVLQTNNILQPFEYCVHLDIHQTEPSFNMNVITNSTYPNRLNNKVWRGFAANFASKVNWESENYNEHGHVGFAWGARREILDTVKLYDRALIGGADHVIAHAAAGQINHSCICKAFGENIDEINEWSQRFSYIVNKKIGFVKGNLYHIWHGNIEDRQYLKRIKDFTPTNKDITKRDTNGLHVTDTGKDEPYVKQYFDYRESKAKKVGQSIQTIRKTQPVRNQPVRSQITKTVYNHTDDGYVTQNDGFVDSMATGFLTDSMGLGTMIGGNPLGAFIGAELRDALDGPNVNDNQFDAPEYGGGQSGGGGATSTWDDTQQNDSTQIYDTQQDNDNFS
jgi:hypothetical protein